MDDPEVLALIDLLGAKVARAGFDYVALVPVVLWIFTQILEAIRRNGDSTPPEPSDGDTQPGAAGCG